LLRDRTAWSISSLFIRVPSLRFGDCMEGSPFRPLAERVSNLARCVE
jgi:hypothetical protein